MASEENDILVEKRGNVAIVTLNRPDRLNAVTGAMMGRFTGVFEELNDDGNVRAVIVTGAGRGFCAGLDLKSENPKGGKFLSAYRVLNFDDHPIARIRRYSKPIIAAVNGVAVGAGLGIACACDIRIASKSAKFGAVFAKVGLSPQDAVGALLPDAVGLSKALEMIFTARMVLSDEALACGLVSQVTGDEGLLDRAMEIANDIAEKPPVALAMAKQVVYRGMGKSMDERMALQNLGSFLNNAYAPNDITEALAAFAEKRTPKFKGD